MMIFVIILSFILPVIFTIREMDKNSLFALFFLFCFVLLIYVHYTNIDNLKTLSGFLLDLFKMDY